MSGAHKSFVSSKLGVRPRVISSKVPTVKTPKHILKTLLAFWKAATLQQKPSRIMSFKIAKKMMASVDEMVARASTAVTRADQPRSKRKAAKRALTGSISKGGAQGSTSGAASAKSGSVSKKKGRRKVGLLEQARRELRGASRAEKNIRLLSYSRKPGQADTKKRASKTQKAMKRLLGVDVNGAAKSGRV